MTPLGSGVPNGVGKVIHAYPVEAQGSDEDIEPTLPLLHVPESRQHDARVPFRNRDVFGINAVRFRKQLLECELDPGPVSQVDRSQLQHGHDNFEIGPVDRRQRNTRRRLPTRFNVVTHAHSPFWVSTG